MYKIELTVETEKQKDQILELLRENEEDGVLDFAFNTRAVRVPPFLDQETDND